MKREKDKKIKLKIMFQKTKVFYARNAAILCFAKAKDKIVRLRWPEESQKAHRATHIQKFVYNLVLSNAMIYINFMNDAWEKDIEWSKVEKLNCFDVVLGEGLKVRDKINDCKSCKECFKKSFD